MTQFAFTSGHDEYGLPHFQLAAAVPRGRNPVQHVDAAREPYLSTYTTTEYARRDDAEVYIVDRVARSANTEVLNDGRQNVFELRDAVFGGTNPLRIIGHTRTFYDGEAFVGLPVGQLGKFGAPVRSESLAFEDDFLAKTFDPADPLAISQKPVYLNPQGISAWPAEYPEEFRSLMPDIAGYVHYQNADIPGSPGGYYVTGERHRYDFHDPSRTPRGLPLVTRDPLGADTAIEYDAFDLLPIRVTDPVGLTTQATYDYRVLQAHEITDANGNIAGFTFSPAGFVTAQSMRGKNGEGDGAHPSVRMEYDLLAFSERRQPMFVRSIRRVHHDSETDVPAEQRDETLVSIEYSDGFGRMLQTRAQAEDTLFGDPIFGGGVIGADQSIAVTDAVGRTRQPGDAGQRRRQRLAGVRQQGPGRAEVRAVLREGLRILRARRQSTGAEGDDLLRPSRPSDADRQPGRLGTARRVRDSDRSRQSRQLPADSLGKLHLRRQRQCRAHPRRCGVRLSQSLEHAREYRDRCPGAHGNRHRPQWPGPGQGLVRHPLHLRYPGQSASASPMRWGAWPFVMSSTSPSAAGAWTASTPGAATRCSMPLAIRSKAATARALCRCKPTTCCTGRSGCGHGTIAAGPVTLRQRMEYGDAGRADQPAAERNAARDKNLLGQLIRHHDEAGLTTWRRWTSRAMCSISPAASSPMRPSSRCSSRRPPMAGRSRRFRWSGSPARYKPWQSAKASCWSPPPTRPLRATMP